MKYFGKIVYSETKESKTSPGVWIEEFTVREYYGDVIRNTRRRDGDDKINDDISVGVQISVVADPFLQQNFHAIRYLEWMGNNWKVSEVEPQFPRMILTLGSLYNGDVYEEPEVTGATGATGAIGGLDNENES